MVQSAHAPRRTISTFTGRRIRIQCGLAYVAEVAGELVR
jgi:hypothetical protein